MKTVDVLKALTLAKAALGPADSPQPILSHFCFMEDILYAYDDVAAIIVEQQTGLNCGLHGDTLLGVLQTLGAETFNINITEDYAEIKTKGGTVKIPVLPASDFVFQFVDEDPIVSLPLTESLAVALDRCLMSVGNDSLAPHFRGVTVHAEKGTVVLYSSDNKTMTRFDAGKFINRKAVSTVIPASSVETMLKLRDKDSKILVGESTATMTTERGATVITKLLPAKPEMFEQLLVAHMPEAAGFPVPVELAREIAMAGVMVQRESVKTVNLACLGDGNMVVTASGVLGKMSHSIPCGWKGKAAIAAPPEQLARILPHVDEMHINHGASVIFFGGKKTEGLLHIIASSPLPEVLQQVAEGGAKSKRAAPKADPNKGVTDLEDDIPY